MNEQVEGFDQVKATKNELEPRKQRSNEQFFIEEKIMRPTGEIYIRKYLRGKQLGRGGFAKCYEVTDLQSKTLLAAKIIPRSSLQKESQKQKLISEIKIHKSLHHPNIVNFEHVFDDKENVYIILEICTNQVEKFFSDDERTDKKEKETDRA